MKNLILFFGFLLAACSTVSTPETFTYREVPAGNFVLAAWTKVTAPDKVYKIYLEGDGHAFNQNGKITEDPTPQSYLMREIAFNDPSPNVIYLARPGQFIKPQNANSKYWSTARFAPEVIDATAQAIDVLAPQASLILIGYSGGAQLAGLIAVIHPELKITRLVTIAGNLDHPAWTAYHRLPPLKDSLRLNDFRQKYLQISQINYIGSYDQVVPPRLTQRFLNPSTSAIVVPDATHGSGWEKIYPAIWNLNQD